MYFFKKINLIGSGNEFSFEFWLPEIGIYQVLTFGTVPDSVRPISDLDLPYQNRVPKIFAHP